MLLDELLEATAAGLPPARGGLLEAWLRLGELEALAQWLGLDRHGSLPSREEVLARLTTDISLLDELIYGQLDALLAHPKLQALEARWRGLEQLVATAAEGDDSARTRLMVRVRLLSASWAEISRDVNSSLEFDQGLLFDKIYNQEFGMPGGEPFGALLADYEVSHSHHGPSGRDDAQTLRSLSQVAAAAFCPLIIAAHPTLFGLESFAGFQRPTDLARTFRGEEYRGWQAFRQEEDARFIGVVLPRVLVRGPWKFSPTERNGLAYRQRRRYPDRPAHLFGSAIFSFGQVLIRAYAEHGWPANIRGTKRGEEGGGLVPEFIREDYRIDAEVGIPKGIVEVRFTDRQERELAELGFIPLNHCHGTNRAAFYSNQSAKAWTRPSPGSPESSSASLNAKLGTMLQYILCVSRFTHYVKVIARDRVGSYTKPVELENMLNNWLTEYMIANENASAEKRARHPLREARVSIVEVPTSPGLFKAVIHLRPHYQMDQVIASAPIVTELFAAKPV